MKYIIGLKATFKNLFFVGLSLILIGWLSVFLYGTFYYLYVPAVAHTRPVFLQFDTSCKKGICGFLEANVRLVKEGYTKLLTKGQPYHVVLDLEMPESEVNQRLGMFMVKISMRDDNGRTLKSSFRSALLVYKSPMIRSFYTFLISPFLIAGTSSEKQILSVSLFENYEENYEQPTHSAFVEVHSKDIEIYSATLRIHAEFSGLRYLMFYWPGLSATVGIVTNFYFLAMIALFSWFRFLRWRGKEVEDLFPIGKAAKETKEEFVKPIPLSKRPVNVATTTADLGINTSASSKAFEVLRSLARTPEKKSEPVTPVLPPEYKPNEGFFVSPSSARVRVLEVDTTNTMSPITEESGLLNSSPGSDAEDALLRKRK